MPTAAGSDPSLDYSFGFDEQLQQQWEWTERYATQPEILRYANHVADRFGLWPDLQFETRIEASIYDESAQRWIVRTSTGDVVSAQHVIMAVGTPSTPKLPEIDGIETFTGATYQTSRWPHEGVDFTGKRVAVIGTGSSAIQSIPLIAQQAGQLVVFQRTANFSVPALNRYYGTVNRDNVTLVNVRRTPITRITATGIDTTDTSFEFDAIIYATGFDALTGSLVAVDVTGRAGVTLKEAWKDGPMTYLGLAASGFPNFHLITGPQSPSVLANMMVAIEQHVDWIADAMVHLRNQNLHTMEASAAAAERWAAHNAEVGNMTLFPQSNSWYMGSNVPGKPRVLLPYLGGFGVYAEQCDKIAASDYEGFVLA